MSSERLTPPAPAVPAAPAAAKPDEKFDKAANARLLLYEVLLDEYHNLEQPELFVLDEEGADDAEAARRYQTKFLAHSKAAPAAVSAEAEYRLLLYRALKARYDDPRGAAFSGPEFERDKDFDDLLGKIRQHVNQLDQSPSDKREAGSEEYEGESEGEAIRERLESRINEELVREFYRLMYAAQARESPPSPPGADAGSGDEGACATAKGNGGGGNGGNGSGNGGGNGGGGGGGGGGGSGGGGGGPAGRYEKAQTRRSALCLSGGGIRSATYNLGILQGLARHGLLGRFDYLSTVSGGGFIGGWLSAWVNRQSVEEVVDRLGKGTSSTLKPDPAPVEHLRVYSNFLSPQPGLLSADTWALVSCLVRNLLLNWFVFLPVIFALLVLPRMFVSLVYASPDFQWAGQSGTLLIAFAAGIVAFAYTGLSLPTVDGKGHARPWWLPKRVTLPVRLAPLPKFWGVRRADPEYRQQQIVEFWAKLRRSLRWAGWLNPLSARLRRRQRFNKWLDSLSAKLDKLKALVRKWRRKRGGQGRFLFFNLLPLVILAGATALYCWAWTKPGAATPSLNSFILFALLIVLVPFVLSSVKVFATAPLSRGENLKRLVGALGGLVIAQCVMGYLLWVATGALLVGLRWEDNPNAPQLYATFAPPAILVLMSLGAVLVAGFSSRFTDDADQEWWARAGAWVLIACVVWIAGHLLVLYGPVLFLWAGALVAKLLTKPGQLSWGEVIKGALPVIGTIVSGAVTLFGGFSAETPANEKEARRAGVGSKLLNVLTGLLAPVFLAFILIIFALVTNWFFLLVDPANSPRLPDVGVPPYPDLLDVLTHTELLRHTHFGDLALFMALMAAASVVFGRLINTNAFSLHHMWRDRIIRAYLGASRAGRRPNRFTGFDPLDNIQMHQLRDQPEGRLGAKEPFKNVLSAEHRQALAERRKRNGKGKLFHVINVALNLTGGDKLAWQDRKAESLTISPLHTGSYWLGYRRTWKYGGYGQREGVSLGTAVAISGAFVSPNMGYMMTSPVVRFLMTLFNVRFGWWLGNPGRAGDGTYLLERPLTWLEGKRPAFNLRSPRLSVLPIVEEAFGHTNDRSPYVYLSDGGHFENLGLYEMVLRRCRYVVVCDASTDAEYSFDSLAMSIRQIRVDLGIPIDLPDLSISGRTKLFKNKYCAVGRIRYSCVDRDPHGPEDAGYYDGVLIYLKPALVGSEPRDVTTYGLGNESFPQEVIVDQWFSEPQFESYRELASHTVNQICKSDHPDRISFEEFRHRAEEHNQLDFRAYSDEIQYAAFEQLFKWNMGQVSESNFKKRAKDYMRDLLK